MATDIDSLQIKIQGTAQGANKSINQLIKNLNTLQSALKSIDTSKLNTFSSGMSKASANGTKFATSLNKVNVSAKTTSKSVNSLASAFGKFYASYFLVVRGVKSFAKSIKSTADYIESFNYYTVAFGKVASEWDEDWEKYGSENARNYSNAFVKTMNDTLGKLSGMEVAIGSDGKGLISSTGTQNLGLNIQEVTQYASQLASVTNSLGQTGKTTLAISQSFTQLAGDISSLFNVDYSTVANNLQSALIGQSRSVYKYGIDITNATLQTYAYKLGLEKAVSEMTQMEKQQLRVLAILDQSKVSFGDLANTINSPSNQMRQLTNNLEQCGVVLGQLFMPIVESVLPVVNGLTIALRQLLVDIAGFFNIKIDFSKFGQGFNQSEEDLEGFGDELDEISEKAKKTQNRLQGFDNLNLISSGKNQTNQSGLNTIDLTNQIVNATSEYQKVWNAAFTNMQSTSKKWAKQIGISLGNVKKLFEDISIGDWLAVGEDVSTLTSELFDYLAKAIRRVNWDELGKNIGNFLKGIKWKDVLSSVGNFLTALWGAALETFSGSFATAPFETTLLLCLGLVNYTPLGSFLAKKIANSWSTAMGTKAVSDTVSAGLSAALGSEAAKSALVFQANSLGTLFANTFVSALGVISAWFVKEKEDSEWQIRNLESKYLAQGYSPETAQERARAEANTDTFWGKVGLYSYDVEKAEAKIQRAQVDIIGKFFKQIGKGFENLLESVKDKPLWFMGYATGGFPEDGFFYANHNELVGKFSNGKTAVANNEQIVAGIERGVESAVSRVLAPYLADIADSSRKTANKNFGITSREVFNATRTEANSYSMRTGKPAFV